MRRLKHLTAELILMIYSGEIPLITLNSALQEYFPVQLVSSMNRLH